MSILFNPLQQVLWGPLQPPLQSQSSGISFTGASEGAFNSDFSFAFDVFDRYEFNTDFSADFAIAAFAKRADFNNDFNADFARIRLNDYGSFNPYEFSTDFEKVRVQHTAAFSNAFNQDFASAAV